MKCQLKDHKVRDLNGTTFKMIEALNPAIRDTVQAIFKGEIKPSVAEQAEDEYPCLVLSKYLYYIESSEGDVTHYLSDLDCIILSNYQERIGGAEGGEEQQTEMYCYLMELTVDLIKKQAWLDGKAKEPWKL